MKATGEVMAIDRSFEAALQKAVRSLETDAPDLLWEDPSLERGRGATRATTCERRTTSGSGRLLAALRRGDLTTRKSHARAAIDRWFTRQDGRDRRRWSGACPTTRSLTPSCSGAPSGWASRDAQIATLAGRRRSATIARAARRCGITPVYKMVDTCAAEFEAATPYFYSHVRRGGRGDAAGRAEGGRGRLRPDPDRPGDRVRLLLGAGGPGARTRPASRAIMINSNPETVSTDFDTSDRLYFEPLDAESVCEILRHERSTARTREVPPSSSSSAARRRSTWPGRSTARGVPILGSGVESIDLAEDRERFEAFLRGLGIPQPPGAAVTTLDEALAVGRADRLSGAGAPILCARRAGDGGRPHGRRLARYLTQRGRVTPRAPGPDRQVPAGKEVEVDAICDGDEVLIPGIMEHIERAGVHSGDSFAVYPGVNLYPSGGRARSSSTRPGSRLRTRRARA